MRILVSADDSGSLKGMFLYTGLRGHHMLTDFRNNLFKRDRHFFSEGTSARKN